MQVTRLPLVALLAFGLSTPAAAQSTEVKKFMNAAIALYENLEYEKALKQLAKAKAKATSPDDESKVLLLEAVVLADMGKEEKALTAFKTAFGMDVEMKLPVEVSPKVQAVADKARANVRKMLAPQLEAQKAEDAKKVADEQKRAAEQAARLAEQKRREEEERARTQPPPAVATSSGDGPSLRTLALIPAGVGVAAGAVSAYFFVSAGAAYQSLIDGTVPPLEAVARRDAGARSQTLGWAFAAGAAGSLIAAVVMFAMGAPPAPVVSLQLVPQGGAILVVQFDRLLERGR